MTILGMPLFLGGDEKQFMPFPVVYEYPFDGEVGPDAAMGPSIGTLARGVVLESVL